MKRHPIGAIVILNANGVDFLKSVHLDKYIPLLQVANLVKTHRYQGPVIWVKDLDSVLPDKQTCFSATEDLFDRLDNQFEMEDTPFSGVGGC